METPVREAGSRLTKLAMIKAEIIDSAAIPGKEVFEFNSHGVNFLLLPARKDLS